MRQFLPTIFILLCVWVHDSAHAEYMLGCEDPEYHHYIDMRFAYYERKNRRLLNETLFDYQRSSSNSDNPYQAMSDLARHLKYSAQFDPIDEVNEKISRIFEHANNLSMEEHLAGYVVDNFSGETHAVGIAKAWLAYRQGDLDTSFTELLTSIELADSAVLGAFGPDFALVRQLYKDGHVEPVVAYIKKTEQFWKGRRPDKLRFVWQQMMTLGCQIQFESIDTIKALELGIRTSR